MSLIKSYGMADQISSHGLWVPQVAASIIRPTLSWGSVIVDAAAEKWAMIGKITTSDRLGSHVISAAGGGYIVLDLGATTFANAGTTLDLGIQDVTGPDADGTFDVKGTFVGGTDPLTGGLYSFDMTTGTKTLAHDQMIAVVMDMTARGGVVDSVSTNCTIGPSSTSRPYMRLNTATWAPLARFPNVLIVCDDGAKAWFTPYGFRLNSVSTTAFQVGTAGSDEYGMRFMRPGPFLLEGLSIPITFASATADFEVSVYSDIFGTPTVVAQDVVDVTFMGNVSTTDAWLHAQFSSPFEGAANTPYGWTVRPTTAGLVGITHYNYVANANMGSLPMGVESYLIKRLDNSGAFSTDTHLHSPFVMHICGIESGGGGSGGITRARLPSGLAGVG